MKTSRNVIRLIFAFAMFLLLMAPVFAATDYGFHWEISEDGVLTISGGGKMEVNVPPWEKQADQIRKVVIGEGFTELDDAIFNQCLNLEEIVFPESMRILPYSVTNSPALKQVYIPAGVVEIHPEAFVYSKNLERIDVDPDNPYFTSDSFGVVYSKDMSMVLIAPVRLEGIFEIPDGVKAVGGSYVYEYANGMEGMKAVKTSYGPFFCCSNLTGVVFNNTETVIGTRAFGKCTSMKEIVIPDSVTVLERSAFSGSGLERIHIGTGVTVIEPYCFYMANSLKEITVPGNVERIQEYAFSTCENLEKVVLEDGITNIEKNAFLSSPKLKDLRLPNTLRIIRDSTFRNCFSLIRIRIPAEVRTIEALAFDNIPNIESLTFEGNAPTFAPDIFDYVGIDFYYPEGNETWKPLLGTNAGTYAKIFWKPYRQDSPPEIPFYVVESGRKDFGTDGTYLQWEQTSDGILRIWGNCFISRGDVSGRYALEVRKIVIEEGVRGISDNAFDYFSSLEEVSLPDSLTEIGQFAFMNCTGLKQITIPAGVKVLDFHAFEGCVNLERIDVSTENPYLASDSYGVLYSKDMTMLLLAPPALSGSYKIQEGTLYVGGPEKQGYSYPIVYSFGEGLYAFEYCAGLTEVWVPDSVIELGYRAFASCESLQQIHMGAGLAKIGENCFSFCNSLKEIVVPGNETVIAERGIAYCGNLEKIVLEEGVTELGADCFANNPKLKEIQIPNSVQSIPPSMLMECQELETVTIPASVTELGFGFANGCPKLREITFEGNAPEGLDTALPWQDLTIRYPEGDMSWNRYVGFVQNPEGKLTWVSYDAHNWVEATCETAKTCTDCGLTSGAPLGHNLVKATCTAPVTCSRCDYTLGSPKNHDWAEASCTAPKTCNACGLTEGEALGHSWTEADCTAPKTCSTCGLAEGKPLGHVFVEGVCTHCGEEKPLGVPGDVTGDGVADYNDALKILRASIGLETLTEEEKLLADVNGDEKADYSDSLLILRWSIGLP